MQKIPIEEDPSFGGQPTLSQNVWSRRYVETLLCCHSLDNNEQYSKVTTNQDVFAVGNFALISLGSTELDEYGFKDRDTSGQKESLVVKILSFFSAQPRGPQVFSNPFFAAQLLKDRNTTA
ncbi:uncharacterized protein JCM6883_007629 [Sporobolomyces salmoneus]|uniref:uncharacterized protein n=1 Tax=Sporobolomyces salmoneus TaxID=183962 RepID=UPI00316C274B